jgi:hypothetical protein
VGHEPTYTQLKFDPWTTGGGRMHRAKGSRRCCAETCLGRKMASRTKNALGGVEISWGEAEWEAIQSVHFASSAEVEW